MCHYASSCSSYVMVLPRCYGLGHPPTSSSSAIARYAKLCHGILRYGTLCRAVLCKCELPREIHFTVEVIEVSGGPLEAAVTPRTKQIEPLRVFLHTFFMSKKEKIKKILLPLLSFSSVEQRQEKTAINAHKNTRRSATYNFLVALKQSHICHSRISYIQYMSMYRKDGAELRKKEPILALSDRSLCPVLDSLS